MTFFALMTFKGRKLAPKSSGFPTFYDIFLLVSNQYVSKRNSFERISDLKVYFDSFLTLGYEIDVTTSF